MSRKPKDHRPDIWSEGRQHPPFEARAFARATLGFAREGLSDLLDRCAASARNAGQAVAGGKFRIPADRLGRSGRYLPSHRSVGAAIAGAGHLLGETALRVRADPEAPPSTLFRPTPEAEPAPVPPMPRPRRTLPAAPAPVAPMAQDPDLAAIRALLSAPQPQPAPAAQSLAGAAPQARPHPAPTARPLDEVNWRRAWLRTVVARTLGLGLLGIAVPYGALRATLAHLNGEDLRKLA